MASSHFTPTILKEAENINMRLKDNLKELIKANGISVAHLSRMTKIPLQTLHGWLSGVEPRSMTQLKKIADHFHISIDEICFGSNITKTKKIKTTDKSFDEFREEINAGIFEVVLRRIKK